MAIDQNEVKRIAALAHLEFDEAGLVRIGGELGKILDYIDQLSAVQLDPLTIPVEPAGTPLGEDVASPSLLLEQTAENAPSFAHGHFVVPKVIGGEP